MSRRSRRDARTLRNYSLEIIEGRAAVSSLALGAFGAVGAAAAPAMVAPRAEPAVATKFHPPRIDVSAGTSAKASPPVPNIGAAEAPSAGRIRGLAPRTILTTAGSDSGVISLDTPDADSGGPLIVASQPSPADRQPGGAGSPKSHGGSGIVAMGGGGGDTGTKGGSSTAQAPSMSAALTSYFERGPATHVVASNDGTSGGAKAAPAPTPDSSRAVNTLDAPATPPALSGNVAIPTPTAVSVPRGITTGPDGNLWFAEYGANKIGKLDLQTGVITEFAVPSAAASPLSIVSGPDGNLWFTEWDGRKIGKVDPQTGDITESGLLPGVGHPYGIAVGSNGNIWFGEAISGKIGEIDPVSMAITQFTVPTNSDNVGIAAGSDGAMWFTEGAANQIGRIDASGHVTEYRIPTSGSYPLSIIAGSDGALWFAEYYGNKNGRIDTSGFISEFPVPSVGSDVDIYGLTCRPDGGIWFAESGTDKIGRIDPTTGTIAEYSEPSSGSEPGGITVGADNALWYTEYQTGEIGRFYPTFINVMDSTTISGMAATPFSGHIATFHDTYNMTTDTNLRAEIEWGDGQTSEGTLTSDGSGNYTVTGSNTYAGGGTFPVTVTLLDGDTEEEITNGDPNGFQIDNTATVADAGLIFGQSFPILYTTNAAPFDGVIGEFFDSDHAAAPDSFTVSIDFGDGEGPREGYCLPDGLGDGGFYVYGDNDFFKGGSYSGLVTVGQLGGQRLVSSLITLVTEVTSAAADVPTIRITSRGSHPGDAIPDPAPTDVEGMKYTVGQSISMPANNATNATRYELAPINWTYPVTAVKGYGRFSITPNGTERFLGDPTDAANTAVKVVSSFTPGDQSYSPEMYGGSANFIDSFYWGPEAVGNQTINVTALFNVYIDNVRQAQQYAATDSVQVNVLRPTGSLSATMGQPGFQPLSPGRPPSYGLDKGSMYGELGIRGGLVTRVTNGIYGMSSIAMVNPTVTDSNGNSIPIKGDSVLGQTSQTSSVRSYIDRNTSVQGRTSLTLPDGSTPIMLDNTFPFGKMPNASGTGAVPLRKGVGSVLTKADSPVARLVFRGDPVSLVRNDSFTTTLYYQPSGGIYVPVGNVTWGWGGDVLFAGQVIDVAGSTFSRTPVTGNPTYTVATDNSYFQTWSHTTRELSEK